MTAKRRRKSRRKSEGISAPLEELLGPDGPLARLLPGYEFRQEQLDLATAVEEGMKTGRACLTEAGTGVGKTIAYLLPALRAAAEGKRTLISTHTISLQSQLLDKDIPLVLSLFPDISEQIAPALLKGRGNFLCKLELENAAMNLLLADDPAVKRLRAWDRASDCTGDVADLRYASPAWSELACSADTCRTAQCAHYDTCWYYRARRAAAGSLLVVVNHALFLSDLALRRIDPAAAVLPDYHHVVMDEAHHLEGVATKAFGVEISSRRIPDLLDRIRHVRGLDIDRSRLDTAADLNDALFRPFLLCDRHEFFISELLDEEAGRQAADLMTQTCTSVERLQKDLLAIAKEEEGLRERLEGIAQTCGRVREELERMFSSDAEGIIRWGDVTRPGRSEPRVTLRLTPLTVAEELVESLWAPAEERKGGVILTSATLASSGSFDYVRTRIGAPEDAVERIVGSPFDFKRQAMLYVPGHLPAPQKGTGHAESYAREIERLLNLTEGRAFLLCTSRAMMTAVHELLKDTLPYPIFVQGEMPPGRLVEAFKASGNGCLFGVQTFWEGIDVQGESLSLVVIDRLPFAVPDSPVTKARTEAIADAGGDWFREFSIPQPQIRLKQGFGRPIRTATDRGIVCILDTRLINRDYGADFVRSLPPASRASVWGRVERFWGRPHPAPRPHPRPLPQEQGRGD